jgi:hypothetical protein
MGLTVAVGGSWLVATLIVTLLSYVDQRGEAEGTTKLRVCLVCAPTSLTNILARPNLGHDQNFGMWLSFGLQPMCRS